MHIKEATNKAKYVEWLNKQTFAVWKGGHTVNFYSYFDGEVTATTCINVGSFENDSATLPEVKGGIKSFKHQHEF